MASIPVTVESNLGQPREGEANGDGRFIRVIVADTQAIFRAGLRKIFALEDDIRVVGQSETMAQTLSAAKKFSADILILESALSSNPAEALSELLRQSPALRVVVVTPQPDEELTLDLFRRGAHGIVSREVEPELLVDCLRKVAEGEPWLDSKGIRWVLEAYRTQATRPSSSRPKVQLTPKESLIVSCVTQGMKNKEIAQRVGTTEQVVKIICAKCMTSWASPTASSWRSSACTIACSNHRQKRPLFLSPHPETEVRPASQPLLKIQRLFRKFRVSCQLSAA